MTQHNVPSWCTLQQLTVLATTLEPLLHQELLTAFICKTSTLQYLLSIKMQHLSSSKTIANKASQIDKHLNNSAPAKRPLANHRGESKEKLMGKTEAKQETVVQNIDQYAEVVSSIVIVAALHEISVASRMDKAVEQQSNKKELNLGSSRNLGLVSSISLHSMPDVSAVTSKFPMKRDRCSVFERKEQEVKEMPSIHPSSVNNLPSILQLPWRKRVQGLGLGGRISFIPQNQQNLHSGSSQFRYSAFASTTVSTPDFFVREKISLLGPMQRIIRTGQVQRPVGLGNIPVPMQRTYKNRGWWPASLPEYMHLQTAHKRELSKNFRDQLTYISEWLYHWKNHERLSLLRELVKQGFREDVLEALAVYIHEKLQDVRDINRLPDKLLLYIFSCLPWKDVLNAAQVCRRWRYLCAVDDIWLIKCLELGEEEGLDNMPHLIDAANTNRMDVDWMLAFMEFHKLVQNKKTAQASCLAGETDIAREDNLSRRLRMRKYKVKSGDKDFDGRSEKCNRQQGRRETIIYSESETGSRMCEEDLSAFMEDDTDQVLQHIEPSANKDPGWAGSFSQSLRSSTEHKAEESTYSSDRTRRDKPKMIEEEEEVTVLDIHTDLSQSRDLLGKVIPATSLEWQTTKHKDDFVRQPVYAGRVLPVQRVRKIQGHNGAIQCLQFDQRRLVTGGMDHITRLWDIRSGRSVHKFLGHKGGVRCLKFDNDILVTGSWDTIILVWNIRHFKRTALLHGHDNSVSCLQLLQHYILSGSDDCTVRVWARPAFICSFVLKGHSGPVLGLTADDKHAYSSGADLTVRMWNLSKGLCERVFQRANHSPVLCLCVRRALLLGGDSDGNVYFWNTMSGEAEAAVQVHGAAVNTISYRCGRFYTGSSDGTVTEYDLVTMTCLRVLRGHKGPVRALQVSDCRFVSCSDDSTVRIWDLHSSKASNSFPIHAEKGQQLSRHLVTGKR